MGALSWRTDITGRKVPSKVHLVDCDTCGGEGKLSDRHPNNPDALEIDCEECGGDGRVRCADDGCCDFDPPEDD